MKKKMVGKLCMAVAAMLSVSAFAQTRTQTVALEKGWNAVWLEVQPSDPNPANVFADASVDVVAGYIQPVSEAQFVKRTTVNLQTLAGWNVWYAPHRADASLSRLQRLTANMGYLVHALEPAVVTVSGEVTGRAIRWTPNRFNLVGFSVAAQGAPTFRQFFEGSKAHNHNKVYRLMNGVWRQVVNTDAEAMRLGEAFWIYCDGGSEFQGPLSVQANTSAGLMLTDAATGELTFRNVTKHPLGFTVELVAGEGNALPPMAAVIKTVLPNTVGLANMPVDLPDGAWSQNFPVLEANGGISFPLSLRIKDLARGDYAGLLKVTTDLGTETWVPLRAMY